MITFVVDDVTPSREPRATVPLASRFGGALAIGDAHRAVIDHGSTHPLLAAVGIAFAEHRPLVLSPDAVWLTIAQGVAQHVRLNAEQLRGRLVRHDGKQRLTLERSSLPRDPAEWASVVGGLRELLAAQIGDGRARVLECDFSTTTDADRIASQIVLLDAYSPYFSYWMTGICGIPEITLLGTPDDWRRIRERVDVIAELDLEWWCNSLRPIADHFARAAAGNVDAAFWKRIYNPQDAYGGETITGWITRLYPYLKIDAAVDRRNHMLELPIDEPKQKTVNGKTTYDGPGVRSDTVPATLSRATLRIVNLETETLGSVELVAGVSAVAQDARGALLPISGWHVEPATKRMADVIDRIFAEHEAVSPDPADKRRMWTVEGSADVIELFSRIDRATLFAGERAWQLERPLQVNFVSPLEMSVRRIARLTDGTSLCEAVTWCDRSTRWIVCRTRDKDPGDMLRCCIGVDTPEQIRVLAGSLTEILDAALDTNGDLSPMIVGTLAE
jgi:Domain of unknown function (DUF4419)